VFKPLDALPESVEWQASILPQIQTAMSESRLQSGRMTVASWLTAWTHVEGQHAARRWSEIISAGVHLHRALAGVPPDGLPSVAHIARLYGHLRPVAAQSQVIGMNST
jgi:hypothetical protein